jgi:general secretion pathway protein J
MTGHPHRNRGAQLGFTLLELLVALAVFAIMATAAYGGLQSVLRTRVAVEAQSQRLTRLQMAFYFLERDLIQAVNRGIRDEYGQPRPALEGNALAGALITFTRAGWDNPLDRQRSTLQRLSYRLRDESLVRIHWTRLDRGGFSEPREMPLLDGVDEIGIRFLDDQNNWQPAWPPPLVGEEPIAPPRAVELRVTLRDWGEITRLFRLPTL